MLLCFFIEWVHRRFAFVLLSISNLFQCIVGVSWCPLGSPKVDESHVLFDQRGRGTALVLFPSIWLVILLVDHTLHSQCSFLLVWIPGTNHLMLFLPCYVFYTDFVWILSGALLRYLKKVRISRCFLFAHLHDPFVLHINFVSYHCTLCWFGSSDGWALCGIVSLQSFAISFLRKHVSIAG